MRRRVWRRGKGKREATPVITAIAVVVAAAAGLAFESSRRCCCRSGRMGKDGGAGGAGGLGMGTGAQSFLIGSGDTDDSGSGSGSDHKESPRRLRGEIETSAEADATATGNNGLRGCRGPTERSSCSGDGLGRRGDGLSKRPVLRTGFATGERDGIAAAKEGKMLWDDIQQVLKGEIPGIVSAGLP